jgi:hypothetical protein
MGRSLRVTVFVFVVIIVIFFAVALSSSSSSSSSGSLSQDDLGTYQRIKPVHLKFSNPYGFQ